MKSVNKGTAVSRNVMPCSPVPTALGPHTLQDHQEVYTLPPFTLPLESILSKGYSFLSIPLLPFLSNEYLGLKLQDMNLTTHLHLTTKLFPQAFMAWCLDTTFLSYAFYNTI